MNYPNDIKDRYADNGSVVHPEYRILAGKIEGKFLFGDVDTEFAVTQIPLFVAIENCLCPAVLEKRGGLEITVTVSRVD